MAKRDEVACLLTPENPRDLGSGQRIPLGQAAQGFLMFSHDQEIPLRLSPSQSGRLCANVHHLDRAGFIHMGKARHGESLLPCSGTCRIGSTGCLNMGLSWVLGLSSLASLAICQTPSPNSDSVPDTRRVGINVKVPSFSAARDSLYE